MTEYKCYECGKMVSENYTKKSIRCPYCGSKILYKLRSIVKKIKAR